MVQHPAGENRKKNSAERAIQAALEMCKPGLGSNVNRDFEDVFDIATCYDWCHAALSPQAKSKLAAALAEAIDKHNYTTKMRRGPVGCRVDAVEVEETTPEGLTTFRITG